MHRRIFSSLFFRPFLSQKRSQNERAIPEAKGFPLLGTLPELLLSGSSSHLHKFIDKRHSQLGPIFRESIGPVRAVFVSDPQLQRQVYTFEGRYPKHVIPDAWKLYNKQMNCPRGILFMDDEEWFNNRRILNSILLKDSNDEMLETCFRTIAKKLVKTWSLQNRVNDLSSSSYIWAVETMVSILIGSADHPEFLKMKDEIKEFALNVNQIFIESSQLQIYPPELVRNLRLPLWRRFENAVNNALLSASMIFKKIMPISKECNGILYEMEKSHMKPEHLQRIAVDLILAAGDTSSNSLQWMLYLLSRNKEYQDLIYNRVNNNPNKKDYENPYLKAILRETLRLYPIAPFITRYMPNDCELGGYNIEAGTLMILSLYTSGRDKNNFQDPDKFWPERWFRESGKYQGVNNPTGSLPFAFGVRSCVGKKIAEMLLKITVSEIIQGFNFELLKDEEIEIILKMLVVPSKSIDIKLSKR